MLWNLDGTHIGSGQDGAVAELPKDFPWKPAPAHLKRWFLNPMLRGGIGHGVLKGVTSNRRLYAHVEWGKAPVLINPEEWEMVSTCFAEKAGGQKHHGCCLA